MPNGIITCTSSNLYQVNVNGTTYNCLARGKFKKEKVIPLPGDQVEITITNEETKEGVLEQISTRKNTLKRPKMANLSQLVFVVSMKLPSPDFLLLDKQLAFAKWLGVQSMICFNKIDLVEQEILQNLVKTYESIGYKVIQTNAKQGVQVEKIKPFLKGQITAFAGNSGVGKSTLLNSVFGKEITMEGVISNKNKRGKNTTTSVTLYPYGNNAYIADTPGFSTFDLTEIASNDLDHYFVEFMPYIEKCKFLRM